MESTSEEHQNAEAALAPRDIFQTLFTKAENKDELEYICSLLRIRGVESRGWDPLEETLALLRDVMGLVDAPLRNDTRLRLGLLAYCHLVEVDAVYIVLENMLRTIEGKRCSISPFLHLYRSKKRDPFNRIPPSAKRVVTKLCEHARRLGEEDLARVVEWMFHDGVRNAFFHSDYVIYGDEFRTRESYFDEGNVRTKVMKADRLADIINRGLAFFEGFMDVYRAHILSYKEPKTIRGRLGPRGQVIPVHLIVDPTHGVRGFRA